MKLDWVPLFKTGNDSPVDGRLYAFCHISDDGGEFYTVREYTRHLAYDLYILCCDGTPIEVPGLTK